MLCALTSEHVAHRLGKIVVLLKEGKVKIRLLLTTLQIFLDCGLHVQKPMHIASGCEEYFYGPDSHMRCKHQHITTIKKSHVTSQHITKETLFEINLKVLFKEAIREYTRQGKLSVGILM